MIMAYYSGLQHTDAALPFSFHGRAVGACLFALGFASSVGLGNEKSDQSGFHPILPLIFCLLVYGRQQKPNNATPIIFRKGKRLAG